MATKPLFETGSDGKQRWTCARCGKKRLATFPGAKLQLGPRTLAFICDSGGVDDESGQLTPAGGGSGLHVRCIEDFEAALIAKLPELAK